MPRKCVVGGCKNYDDDRNFWFHSLGPIIRNKKRMQEWSKALKIPATYLTPRQIICSKHFNMKTDYCQHNMRMRELMPHEKFVVPKLIETAVPMSSTCAPLTNVQKKRFGIDNRQKNAEPILSERQRRSIREQKRQSSDVEAHSSDNVSPSTSLCAPLNSVQIPSLVEPAVSSKQQRQSSNTRQQRKRASVVEAHSSAYVTPSISPTYNPISYEPPSSPALSPLTHTFEPHFLDHAIDTTPTGSPLTHTFEPHFLDPAIEAIPTESSLTHSFEPHFLDPAILACQAKYGNSVQLYSCPKESCNLTFTKLKTFNEHMINHEKGDIALYKCETCSKLFVNEEKCKLHIQTHEYEEAEYLDESSLLQDHYEEAGYLHDSPLQLDHDNNYGTEDSKSQINRNEQINIVQNFESVEIGSNLTESEPKNDNNCDPLSFADKKVEVDFNHKLLDPAIYGYKATSMLQNNTQISIKMVKCKAIGNSSIEVPRNLNPAIKSETVQNSAVLNLNPANKSEIIENSSVINSNSTNNNKIIEYSSVTNSSPVNISKTIENSSVLNSNPTNNSEIEKNSSTITAKSDSLKEKWLQSDSKNNYYCSLCKNRFQALSQLNLHSCTASRRKSYECEYCRKRYVRLSDLYMHRERIHKKQRNKVAVSKLANNKPESRYKNPKLFKCLYCSKKYTTPSNVKTHMMLRHTDLIKNRTSKPEARPTNMACQFCKTVFLYKETLQVHIEAHIEENNKNETEKKESESHSKTRDKPKGEVRLCPYCYLYYHKDHLKYHIQTEHKSNNVNINTIECQICNLRFMNHKLFSIHNKVHCFRPEVKQCFYCKKIVSSLTAFNGHVRRCRKNSSIVTQEVPKYANHLGCHFCKETFPTKNSLSFHINEHLVTEFKAEYRKDCHQFEARYRNDSHQFEAVYIKTAAKEQKQSKNLVVNEDNDVDMRDPLEINEVGEILARCDDVSIEKVVTNQSKQVKPHKVTKCESCIKYYQSNHDYVVDAKLQTKKFPYQCGKCGQVFRTVEQLQNYVQKLRDVTWHCKFCKMSKFSDLKGLTNHYGKYHKNIYKCPICKQLESTISNLTLHIKSHKIDDNTVESCKCGFCDRVFSSKMLLQSHIALHLSIHQNTAQNTRTGQMGQGDVSNSNNCGVATPAMQVKSSHSEQVEIQNQTSKCRPDECTLFVEKIEIVEEPLNYGEEVIDLD